MKSKGFLPHVNLSCGVDFIHVSIIYVSRPDARSASGGPLMGIAVLRTEGSIGKPRTTWRSYFDLGTGKDPRDLSLWVI